MSWKDKIKRIDWFKNINLWIGGAGWALVFIALIFTMVGTAHYLALYTTFNGIALRILLFSGIGIGLIYVYYLLEIIRIRFCKGDKK